MEESRWKKLPALHHIEHIELPNTVTGSLTYRYPHGSFRISSKPIEVAIGLFHDQPFNLLNHQNCRYYLKPPSQLLRLRPNQKTYV